MILGILLYFFIIVICLIMPLVITTINIINLFKKKRIKENLFDVLTFVLGISLTILLMYLCDFKDYTQSLRIGGAGIELHSPIASWSLPTVVAIIVFGTISYFVIRYKKLDLPPLVVVTAMSGILICSIFMVIFIIQLSNNIMNIPYLALFPINYILCGIRAQIDVIKRYKQKNIQKIGYNNKFLNKCNKILCNIDNWPIISVILVLPIACILICILMLFGQRPDEIIKAFLETSDWTLSTKVSPPPITYDAHYLCTVSLKGHKKIVKPIRMGIRRGEKIVVNRQLCVANAFEDLIQEKMPKFHHFIRHIYDKYGYPLSKHINTKLQADITYILMKPLEWLFLAVLYLFDKKPENRIATQYIGNINLH